MKKLKEDGIQLDSIVTDPPYHLQSIVSRFSGTSVEDKNKTGENCKSGKDSFGRLAKGFMGKAWDGGDIAFKIETWRLTYDLLKPGGHMLAFSGTRTYHRMVCAIEDAGFEIRDQLGWLYATGFPKSQNISKFIDKFDPEEAKQWDGWRSALKPNWEPIVLVRKPLSEENIAKNVVKYDTGGLNIDACRIGDSGGTESIPKNNGENKPSTIYGKYAACKSEKLEGKGRYTGNIIHDGSYDVIQHFPKDSARIFYCAKADKKDRAGSNHPTVKPQSLLRYLCRLITPPNGVIMDPFAGSGSTLEAAVKEGFFPIGIEKEKEYFDDIKNRLKNMRLNNTLKDLF